MFVVCFPEGMKGEDCKERKSMQETSGREMKEGRGTSDQGVYFGHFYVSVLLSVGPECV